MTNKNRQIISTAFVATVGIGLVYILTKYRKNILQKIRTACDIRNPLKNQKIEIINNSEECKKAIHQLKSHCSEYNVLGFDCEWVTVDGSRRPIALLQLASHKGLCALIRLCHLKRIPPELRELLENDEIIKVGVGPQDDAAHICRDYSVGVASTLDLRHLAHYADLKPESLAKMSKTHLNVELDKNWRIRCSDWEAYELTEKQIIYAAKDAHVAIELFKTLSQKIVPNSFWWSRNKTILSVIEISQKYLDIRFKQSWTGNSPNPNKEFRKKLLNMETSNGHFSKQIKRNLSTRSKPLYNNCFMQAPDGELLCTMDRKKADWYIGKDLAILITDDPYTVQLKFEPSGRAVGDVGKYYTQPKINQCVVCGKKESYIRKNVVPREYRRYFPVVMKAHVSHDVLLLCTHCHQISNISDLRMRENLAELCSAPMVTQEGGAKFIENPELKSIKSAARALYYNSHKIPEDRLEVLRKQILDYYPSENEISEEFIFELCHVNTNSALENYCSHGEKVVEYFKNFDNGGLVQLERLWREHFLERMKPKFLPELWSVTHSANRLEIRAEEGRVNSDDLVVAGLDPNLLVEKKKVQNGNFLLLDTIDKYDSEDSNSLASQPATDDDDDKNDDDDRLL